MAMEAPAGDQLPRPARNRRVRITGAEDQFKRRRDLRRRRRFAGRQNSIITGNEAELGGGINTNQTHTTITNSEISDNTATVGNKSGGGLYSRTVT